MSRGIFVLGLLALVAVTYSQGANVSTDKLSRAAAVSAEAESDRHRRDTLPGRNKSPEQQCRDRRPGYYVAVCETDDPADLCVELKCASNRGDIPAAEETGLALDGTWCGDKKMCFEGSCIEDVEPLESPFKIAESVFCME